jgi:hypothetical protein
MTGGVSMNDEDVWQAQVRLIAKTPNAICPCCAGNSWLPMPNIAGLVVGQTSPSLTGGPSESIDTPVQFDVLALSGDVVGMVALKCGDCGFIRFHT